jgi:hypothetical protein
MVGKVLFDDSLQQVEVGHNIMRNIRHSNTLDLEHDNLSRYFVSKRHLQTDSGIWQRTLKLTKTVSNSIPYEDEELIFFYQIAEMHMNLKAK